MLLFDEPFIDGWLGRRMPAGSGTPSTRVALAQTESLGFSTHSLLYHAVAPGDYGDLGAGWTGALDIAYGAFSSLKQRRDANGSDRNGSYSGALIVTEICKNRWLGLRATPQPPDPCRRIAVPVGLAKPDTTAIHPNGRGAQGGQVRAAVPDRRSMWLSGLVRREGDFRHSAGAASFMERATRLERATLSLGS